MLRLNGLTQVNPSLRNPIPLTTIRLLASAWIALGGAMAFAQEELHPRMLAISPAGAQAGQTVEVTITEQQQLEEADGLVFSHPGIKAKQMMNPADLFYPEERPEPFRFEVAVPSDVPPGIYEVRATGPFGLSNVRRFVVGNLPELQEVESNNRPEEANEVQIGSVMNGRFATDFDYFRFTAKQGQRILIDCMAERIDSRGNPVLSLFNANGQELDRCHDAIGVDAMLDFRVPADGEYYVRVNDLLYTASGGNNSAPYRLTLTQGPWIDFIEPPIAQRGGDRQFVIYGRNLGGSPSGIKVRGVELEKLPVTISLPGSPLEVAPGTRLPLAPSETPMDVLIWQHTTGQGVSNPVRIVLTDAPLASEQEPNDLTDQSQKVTLPADLLGRFDSPRDRDGFQFDAKQGEQIWIEVESHRLGQMTDPVLVVQQLVTNNEGKTEERDIRSIDDLPSPSGNFRVEFNTNDPGLMFDVPQDGTYRVLVRDQFNGSKEGRLYVYRLRIRAPQPDFRIAAVADLELDPNNNNNRGLQPRSCVVHRGGAVEILLVAHRQDGFDGEITVRLNQNPPGIQSEPVIIAGNNTMNSLVLRADPNAAKWVGTLDLVAEATINGQTVTRNVEPVEILFDTQGNDPTPCRVTSQIMLMIDETPTPLPRLEWVDNKVWRMPRGGRLEIPVRLIKQGDFGGNVSPQPVGVPERINKQNPNIGPGNEGKIVLDIQESAVPGKFTIVARGEVQMNYRRNVEAMEKAKEDRDRINKVAQDLQNAYQEAQQNRSRADQMINQAQGQLNTANNNVNSRQQQSNTANQQMQQAQQQLDQKKKELTQLETEAADLNKQIEAAQDENARNQLKQQLQQKNQQIDQKKNEVNGSQKQYDDAATRAKTAADELTKAQEEQTKAQEALKSAQENRQKAGEDEEQARQMRDLGQRKRQEADQIFRQKEQVSNQRNLRFWAYSPALVVEVVDYPAELTLSSQKVTVKAGEKFELTAQLKRDFNFNDEVNFSLQNPGGLNAGLPQNPKIPGGQNEVKFEIQIAANTQPGQYTTQLIARMRFNNRNLEKRIPLEVTVEPKPEQ